MVGRMWELYNRSSFSPILVSSWPSFSFRSNNFVCSFQSLGMRSATGRRKLLMRKIEDPYSLSATLSKRTQGIFKKANELSVLCGGQTAVVLFSPVGNPFSFGNPDVGSVIDRFLNDNNTLPQNETPTIRDVDRNTDLRRLNQQLDELSDLLDAARKRGAMLKKKNEQRYHYLLNTSLQDLSLQDLENLMKVMDEVLKFVFNRSIELYRSSSSSMAPNGDMDGLVGGSIQNMTAFSNELIRSSSTFTAQALYGFTGPSIPHVTNQFNEVFASANSAMAPNFDGFAVPSLQNGKEKFCDTMIGLSSSLAPNMNASVGSSAPNVTNHSNELTWSSLTSLPSNSHGCFLSPISGASDQSGGLVGSSTSLTTPNLYGFVGPSVQNPTDQLMEWMLGSPSSYTTPDMDGFVGSLVNPSVDGSDGLELGPSLVLNQHGFVNPSDQSLENQSTELLMESLSSYVAHNLNGIVGSLIPDVPNQNNDLTGPSSARFVAPSVGECFDPSV